MKSLSSCLIILSTISMSSALSAATIKEMAAKFAKEQTVSYVPISVDDITIIIPVGKGMPSDPGVTGNKTMAGIDADKDGIRDDVERKISQQYSNNPKARAYSYILAMKYQDIIIESYSKTSVVNSIKDMLYTADCLGKLLPNTQDRGSALILPWVLNTYARSHSYINALSLMGGDILPTSPNCAL